MTHEERIKYLRIALSLQKIPASDEICDRILETVDAINTKGGEFSVHDAVDIELRMDRKYAETKIKE
jgi:hypothetical protein